MELTPDLQEKKISLIEGLKKTYKEQYDAIQPLPYIKDRLYCVDKVFVEGGIEVCLSPELTRDTRGSWERLESYKSIYTDFRCKSKRRIIQGEPGYGKSTLTLQLAYDWCNDVSDSPMSNVEILILLRLRQLGRVKHLCGAIKLFLLSHEPRVSIHDIEKIINSCSSVHITLDGYDEYPGRGSNGNDDVHRIIEMELFADFDVSLTTRYLPECLRKETKRAKLTGFDDKARDEYIRKAVVGNNDEAVEKIKQRLYENSILADLCQVPLIFVMFAHMAHDERDFMKFKSVTQFFKQMIRCFYDHVKQKFKDNRSNMFYLHDMEHHELYKIAFEGLNKINQQLSWIKTEFCERVGPESYHKYTLIGILVEEDVVSDDSTVENVLFTTEVRFYHKLFCEWYAAHHLVTLVKNAYDINETLRFLDPVDLQYLFRFACGLDPDAGKKLINHLKKLRGGDTFAILCILEQTGDVNDIMDSVKDLCSRDVKIQEGDSALLQRSTTQLLEIASKNDIPISCLHLEYSSIKSEGDTIILHSGIPLPILPTVEKIHIDGRNEQYGNTESLSRSSRSGRQYDTNRTLTEKDVLNLFHYGMKCRRVKELIFDQFQLPTSFSPGAFTDTMKTQNIQVCWRPFDIEFHLDLQNGHWEVDDIQMILNENLGSVSLSAKNSILQDMSTLQLLEVARNHDIPVSCLHLEYSSIKFEGDTIKLHSGIPLPILPAVEKIHIAGSYAQYGSTGTLREKHDLNMLPYRNPYRQQYEDEQDSSMDSFTEMENFDMHFGGNQYLGEHNALQVNPETLTYFDILSMFRYGMKCGRVKELMFNQFQLPTAVSPEAFTDKMKTQKIQVRWRPFDIYFHLDLETGHWEVDNMDTLRQLCSDTVHIRKSDDTFKQKFTIMFIHNASSHEIPISCLNLIDSFSKIDAGDVILHSGLRLSCPVSVKKVVIQTEKGREMTETEVVDILIFVQKSHMLKKLWFDGCLLPPVFFSGSIPAELKSRNIKVFWNDYSYRLNLQSGVWEVDKYTVRKLCKQTLTIRRNDSELLQRCTLKLLANASYYDIPIPCLYLDESFSKIDTGDVILHSGLRLPCPASLKKVVIDTGTKREMTETEVVDILMFVQQSHMLKELWFDGCLLPPSFSSESIPAELKSRNIKVFWNDYGYSLDLQSGIWKVDDIDTVSKLCTGKLEIRPDDTELLQRCTIKLLENASYYDIPISGLHLMYSSVKFEGDTIILHDRIPIPILPTVEKIHIIRSNARYLSSFFDDNEQYGNTGTLTEMDVLNWFQYVMKCGCVKELIFEGFLLPLTLSLKSIPAEMQSRDIKVLWSRYGYRLNLQSGDWEVDDVETVSKLCKETVEICHDHTKHQQRCTIKLLKNASDHDIPISCLHLEDSFSKIDAGDVILHSGLRMSCPVSVKKVVIFAGREMTETEVVQILMFVEQSHMLEELWFRRCLLPQSIPAESITSRNVKVTWWSVNDKYELNPQTGRWEDSETRQEITDTKYNDKKTRFHFFCSLTGSESEGESESETESESDNEYNQ